MSAFLVGLTIVEVRPMTDTELEDNSWDPALQSRSAPPVIVLSDGTKLYPSQDSEGNGPGVLFAEDVEGFFRVDTDRQG